MEDWKINKLEEQLKADIKNSKKELPKKLKKELLMDVKLRYWIFAQKGYDRKLMTEHPEYKDEIDSIFASQLALGDILAREDT